MSVARASPRCMDWLHFLDTSGLGLLWRIIRGLWILDFGFWIFFSFLFFFWILQTHLLAIRRVLCSTLHTLIRMLCELILVFSDGVSLVLKIPLWLIAPIPSTHGTCNIIR